MTSAERVFMHQFTLVALLSLVGCATSFDASLTDHADALTVSGTDKLFEVEVSTADANVAVEDVQLTYQPVGGTMTVLNFALTIDSNSDGAVGEGDTLTAMEPGPDLLNTANAGQTFDIVFAEKTGPAQVSVHWEGTWSAQ